MYAIIETGGKQYKVAEGSVAKFETLSGEEGTKVSFDKVLLVKNDDNVIVGKPLVEKASVEGSIVTHGRAKKVMIFKKKRRKTYKKTQGHRQNYTEVKIEKININ